jgi:hypothetical protein
MHSPSKSIKDEANLYEANVWGNNATPKYVAPFGSGLEFWVESPTIQTDVRVGPTPSTIPTGATTSESVLQQEINAIEPDTLSATTAFNDTHKAYAGNLGLGATAAVDGNTVFVTVYHSTATTVLMVHPV